MSLDPQVLRLADVLPEYMLFLNSAGTILWANCAALEMLQAPQGDVLGKALSEFVSEAPSKLQEYLDLCSRGSHFSIGSLTLKTSHGELIPCRCEGGMLERAAASGESVLLLRQRPKEDASRQFLLLNEQISLLSRARHELESRIAIRTSDLTAAQTALRELSAKLLRAQDDERRRLARDLHDSTGQLLTAMLLNLSVLMQDAAALPAESVSRLSETVELANQAITEIRTMSYLLHPPMLDEAGLEMALQWYVDGFRKRSNIRVYLSVPTGLHRLDRDVELAVFRIVQECLTNIHRHSGSALAQIMLSVESGKLILVIRDEGRGLPFPPGDGDFKQSGVGIRGMQERVRQLDGSIQFQAGNPGTLVRVELPLSGRTLDSADQSRRAAGLQPD